MPTPQEIAENELLDSMGIGRIIPQETQMPRHTPLNVRVANILKRELDIGTFDDTCMKDEITMIDAWVWHTLIFYVPVEEV